jgi:hypothetical protein
MLFCDHAVLDYHRDRLQLKYAVIPSVRKAKLLILLDPCFLARTCTVHDIQFSSW